jgi:ribonuclease HI
MKKFELTNKRYNYIIIMSDETINVYTDGSYVKKGSKIFCGYGIYFPDGEYKDISRKFTHEPITNNRAELYAILKTVVLCNKIFLDRIKNNKTRIKTVNIYSDSEYSIKSLTIWLPKWKTNGKDYLNKDIIDDIDECISKAPFQVKLIHVRAHTGGSDPHSISNNVVDELAKRGAFRE